jgi:hypothetical protein
MKFRAQGLLLIKWKFRHFLYVAKYCRTATLVGSEQSGKYKDDRRGPKTYAALRNFGPVVFVIPILGGCLTIWTHHMYTEDTSSTVTHTS